MVYMCVDIAGMGMSKHYGKNSAQLDNVQGTCQTRFVRKIIQAYKK